MTRHANKSDKFVDNTIILNISYWLKFFCHSDLAWVGGEPTRQTMSLPMSFVRAKDADTQTNAKQPDQSVKRDVFTKPGKIYPKMYVQAIISSEVQMRCIFMFKFEFNISE